MHTQRGEQGLTKHGSKLNMSTVALPGTEGRAAIARRCRRRCHCSPVAAHLGTRSVCIQFPFPFHGIWTHPHHVLLSSGVDGARTEGAQPAATGRGSGASGSVGRRHGRAGWMTGARCSAGCMTVRGMCSSSRPCGGRFGRGCIAGRLGHLSGAGCCGCSGCGWSDGRGGWRWHCCRCR